MSHVLIWKNIAPGSEYDIFRQVDCQEQYKHILKNSTFNVGNRLWFQGIMSAVDTEENTYSFLSSEMSPDYINHSFDFIILPMANIFNAKFTHYLTQFCSILSKIHIPIYVIACGAQADKPEDLDLLIQQIGDLSKRFISTIYDSGGEFALRGHFTKSFFDQLGFSSAVVTGCPSMYQFGPNFTVNNSKTDPANLRPVFNGEISMLSSLFKHYPNSAFMDQDNMFRCLYQEKNMHPTLRDSLSFFCLYDICTSDLLAQDRIKLIPDMFNWRTYLIKEGFNYSFGSRIHGNIMAILSGIPATVIAIDTRTLEMAEFFKIPYIKYQKGHTYSSDELQDLYLKADFNEFNKSYSENYSRYASFLQSHGIVSKINTHNRFFLEEKNYLTPPPCVNQNYYAAVRNQVRYAHPLFQLYKLFRYHS